MRKYEARFDGPLLRVTTDDGEFVEHASEWKHPCGLDPDAAEQAGVHCGFVKTPLNDDLHRGVEEVPSPERDRDVRDVARRSCHPSGFVVAPYLDATRWE